MEQGVPDSSGTLGEDFHRAFESALVQARKRLGQVHRLWINGKSLKSKSGTFQSFLPADSRILAGKFQKATRDQVHKAIATAQASSRFWREFGWQERIAYLRKAAELIAGHQHELAALISLEVGKNRIDAFAEVTQAVQAMVYYCNQTERHQGFAYRLNGSPGNEHQCALRPHGVWALISSFNFPLSIPAGTAIAALAGGNTMVFKPSSRAALVGSRFNTLLHDAGLPVGVFNLITGPGSELVKPLLASPDVAGLAFSGTTEVGMSLLRQFAGPYPRPCLAAMGSNNPVIVMPTADVAAVVEGVVQSAFGWQWAALRRLFPYLRASQNQQTSHRGLAANNREVKNRRSPGTRYGDGSADQRERRGQVPNKPWRWVGRKAACGSAGKCFARAS